MPQDDAANRNPDDRPAPNRNQTIKLWMLSQTAWQLIFFVLLGLAIDRWAETEPWGVVTCSAIGMVSTIVSIIRIATPPTKQ